MPRGRAGVPTRPTDTPRLAYPTAHTLQAREHLRSTNASAMSIADPLTAGIQLRGSANEEPSRSRMNSTEWSMGIPNNADSRRSTAKLGQSRDAEAKRGENATRSRGRSRLFRDDDDDNFTGGGGCAQHCRRSKGKYANGLPFALMLVAFLTIPLALFVMDYLESRRLSRDRSSIPRQRVSESSGDRLRHWRTHYTVTEVDSPRGDHGRRVV
eukprot:scaffold35220_cov34-Tisochrysis_lutea.AAC.4